MARIRRREKRARMAEEELVIFDSTGSGVQDVATAWAAYLAASRTGTGVRFDLSGSPADQSAKGQSA